MSEPPSDPGHRPRARSPSTGALGRPRANGARRVSPPRSPSSSFWRLWLGGNVFGPREAPAARRPRRRAPFAPRRNSSRPSPSKRCDAWIRQRGIDRRQDRGQRRSRDAGVLALLGPRHPGHRRAGRYASRRARRSPRSKPPNSCRRRTISKRPPHRSSSRASTKPASTPCTMPRAAACRTGSRRRPTWRPRKPHECGAQSPADPRQVRSRHRALGIRAVDDPVATLTAPIAGVVVDRQVGPGQYLQAARHAGVHHRRSLERVAAGQCARGRCRAR